jgi:hypothetical protein
MARITVLDRENDGCSPSKKKGQRLKRTAEPGAAPSGIRSIAPNAFCLLNKMKDIDATRKLSKLE